MIKLSDIENSDLGYIVFNPETFFFCSKKECITNVDENTVNIVACSDDKRVIVVNSKGVLVAFKKLSVISTIYNNKPAPYTAFRKGAQARFAIAMHESESLCVFVMNSKKQVHVRIYTYDMFDEKHWVKTPLKGDETILYAYRLNAEATKKVNTFRVTGFENEGLLLDILVNCYKFGEFVPDVVLKSNDTYFRIIDPTKPVMQYRGRIKKFNVDLPASSVFSPEIPKVSDKYTDNKYIFRKEAEDLVRRYSGNRFRNNFICPICYQDRFSGYSYTNSSGRTVRVCDFCRAEILRQKGWVHIINTNMGHGR